MASYKGIGFIRDVFRYPRGSSGFAVNVLVENIETKALVEMAGSPWDYPALAFAAPDQKVRYDYGTTNGFYEFAIIWEESPRPWDKKSPVADRGSPIAVAEGGAR